MEQSNHHRLVIHQIPGVLAVVQLGPEVALPAWASAGAISATVRTSQELTVVCDEADVPDGVPCERGWVALMLDGTFPFNMTGVLASLLVPLAESGISVFAVSTFSTDCVLVKAGEIERAKRALEERGHRFVEYQEK